MVCNEPMLALKNIEEAMRSLFPEACCLCQKQSDNPVCEDCESIIKSEIKQRIEVNNIELRYLLSYDIDLIQKWLHVIKFEGNSRAAIQLSQFLTKHVSPSLWNSCDLVIPVPIHRKRKRQRGYNQVDLVMKPVAVSNGVSYLDVIDRHKVTKPLFKLDREERKRELENAFRLNPSYTGEFLSDKTVCLVDDIFTTGATLTVLSSLLKEYGVKKVIAVTLARA